MHDVGDIRNETVDLLPFGNRSVHDRQPGDLRLAWPLGLGAFYRVEPWRIARQKREIAGKGASPLRALGIEPKIELPPSSKTTSTSRRMRGDSSARRVAIVLCR